MNAPVIVQHPGIQPEIAVAALPDEVPRGLMFRTEMGADEGMVFPRNPARASWSSLALTWRARARICVRSR